jgi:AraC family transcriptional regulator
MFLRIQIISAKRLIGLRISTSLANNKTGELWRSFMPRRKEIKNSVGSDLYSVQLYDSNHFINFNIDNVFEKCAAVEVEDFDEVPEGMETILIPEGGYAVFQYKGAASAAAPFFQYIFTEWLPNSGYLLDNRPHFEILGERYKNDHPDSEEEVWIPIKTKG